MSPAELPKIPAAQIIDCSQGTEIETEMTEFFNAVCNRLGYSSPRHRTFIEIRQMVLAHPLQAGVPVVTDDFITTLYVKNVPVAAMIEQRSDFNYVYVSYSYLIGALNELIRHQITFNETLSE